MRLSAPLPPLRNSFFWQGPLSARKDSWRSSVTNHETDFHEGGKAKEVLRSNSEELHMSLR